MRAGPLTDPTVIRLLNTSFVNTWVLKGSPKALLNQATADGRRLAAAVHEARQKGSPVDCIVYSPELERLACQPVHDLLSGEDWSKRYLTFLNDALVMPKK